MNTAIELQCWAFALLFGWQAWQLGVELFIAWYSGVDPPLSTAAVSLLSLRAAVLMLAAVAVATATVVASP